MMIFHLTDLLLKTLHETNTAEEQIDLTVVEESPIMWQHRSRLVVDNLAKVLTERMSQQTRQTNIVLTMFMEQVEFGFRSNFYNFRFVLVYY